MSESTPGNEHETSWDHSAKQEFFDYYSQQSTSPETLRRFKSVRRTILDVMAAQRLGTKDLQVADIGCGAGSNSFLWAELGHRVHGLDVNAPLIEVAKKRRKETHSTAQFQVGSATHLPWEDEMMDVCLIPELLEHVPEWERCLDECARILKPSGVLFLSTTNKLCPLQQEFQLPLYSWYPRAIKRHYEHLARTSRPELAGHATYPAVNWFSYYSLRRELCARGMAALDRFDMYSITHSGLKAAVARVVRGVPPMRWLAHVATPYTRIIAIKR